MQKHNFFVKQIFFQDEVEILTFFDGVDDFGDDDEDEYSYNSVNFQAKTSRFCMEIDLDNSYQIMMMMMIIIMMMMMIMMLMMMIIAVTQSIFKLGPQEFAWKYIQIISNR